MNLQDLKRAQMLVAMVMENRLSLKKLRADHPKDDSLGHTVAINTVYLTLRGIELREVTDILENAFTSRNHEYLRELKGLGFDTDTIPKE